MRSVLAAELAELLELELVGGLLLILGGRVVLTFALSAIQTNDNAHRYFPRSNSSNSKRGRALQPSPSGT